MNQTSYDDLCNKIISIDKTIRFVGIANKSGVLVSSAYRDGSVDDKRRNFPLCNPSCN